MMKPTKEKEEIRHLEKDGHKESYESSNLNLHTQKPIMTTMSSDDINFDSKSVINTPRTNTKHIPPHKVSFNEGISEINERSDTKYDKCAMGETNKSTALRDIVLTMNDEENNGTKLPHVQEEQ